MKLRTLDLVAFGPFTRHSLDFGSGPAGFGVVYGPNEAGKSTARRAVLGLLYGIPENTRDAHLHASADLAVGALFVGRGGKSVRLVRRKKRKDSLRDASDSPVLESTMIELLGGVERAVFTQLFCFGHEELKEGGQALLDGKGDAGRSLFDAGAGGAGIHRVLARLDAEADELYLPKGKKPKLNRALETYKNRRQTLKQAIQLPEDWQKQKQALDELRADQAEAQTRWDTLRSEQRRLERIQRALPFAVRYADLRAERALLGELPRLPEDAGDRRLASLELKRDAERGLEECARRAQRLVEARAGLAVDDAVLGAGATSIQQLAEALAVSRSAARDLPKRVGERDAAEDEARSVLGRLGRPPLLEGVEALRLNVAERERIDELVQQGSDVQGRLKLVERECAESVDALARLREQSEKATSPGDLEPLRRAIARGQRAGDLDARLRQLDDRIAELEPRARQSLGRLAPWQGDASTLSALGLPSRDTVQAFEATERRLTERKAALGDQLGAARRELAALERQIAELQGVGQVPDEALLQAARNRRDAGWRLVVRAWQHGPLPEDEARAFDTERTLAEAYERAVTHADDVSDRLRREATRIAELAGKRTAMAQVRAAIDELETKLLALDVERDQWARDWAQAWIALGIVPEGVPVMRDWLARAEAALESCTQLSDAQRQRTALDAQRSTLVAALLEFLGDEFEGEATSLDEALSAAGERLRAHEGYWRDRAELERRARDRSADREALREEWARWQADWAQAIARLGLGTDASPKQVYAVLGEIEALFDALARAAERRTRIASIERDQRAFAERVVELVGKYAPDLSELAPADAAERLVDRFDAARSAASERGRLDEELAGIAGERERFEADLRAATVQLDDLLTLAGISDPAELARLEDRARRALQLDGEIADAERELRRIAEAHGLHVDVLCTEAEGVDGAELATRLESLRATLDELTNQIHESKQRIASVEAGLDRYRVETGAEAAQLKEASAAEALEYAQRYARLRLAGIVLRRQIERYRQDNQDPIVARASELFHQLTLGSFAGIRIGVEARVLYCLRPDGKDVEVEGLSEGTRYQLYFALRLASLERHLDGAEAMPLLLDDTFIHFDDERMLAAFSVLGDLARRTQVIYFTHHRHHLELARRALEPGALSEHELGAARASAQLELPSAH